jgi:lipoate-protein ligase A
MSSSQPWRLIMDIEPQDAYTNMAEDEALLNGQIGNGSQPTIRFYSWRPAAISLGYAQDIATIDLEACRISGIGVVRRITGGRAILHEDDFTYSITARDDNPIVQGTLMDTYRKISQALLAGLQQLGVQTAAFARGDRNPNSNSTAGDAAACFAASSRYELTVGGKKIIGSAQRRKQGAVLQQGSLPLQDHSKKLFDLLRFSEPDQRTVAHEHYTKKAISLSDVLCHPVTFDITAAAFLEGLKNTFQVEIVRGSLDPDEIAQVERLRASKYASDNWNYFGREMTDGPG